jgi:capsular polysaccharide biosynthesis protein
MDGTREPRPYGTAARRMSAAATALLAPRPALANGKMPPEPPSRGTVVWRARRLIVAVAVACAVLTLAVSSIVPATYSSSATVRVTLPPGLGNTRDSVLASNDLASQYAQLVESTPVLADAAGHLGMSGGSLRAAVSAGTIADQNLISVNADAPSANESARRANALAEAFTRYLSQTNAGQTGSYAAGIDRRLRNLRSQINTAQAAMSRAAQGLDAASQSRRAAANAAFASQQSILGNLLGERQQLVSYLAQVAAAGQPEVAVVATADPGDKVQPRPALYALLALVVGALVTAQIALIVHRPA